MTAPNSSLSTIATSQPRARAVAYPRIGSLGAPVPCRTRSNDPTGAAIVWPVAMLAFYAVVGLGFVLVR